jgi:uridine kinase
MRSTLAILHRSYLFFAGLMLLVGLSACGETKVSQCNRLVKILNPAKVIAIPQDAAAQSQAANTVDDLRQLAQAEVLSDPKIKAFQEQIVQHLSQASQLLRDASKASSDRDLTQITKIQQATQTFMAKEPPLLSQLNSYCAE